MAIYYETDDFLSFLSVLFLGKQRKGVAEESKANHESESDSDVFCFKILAFVSFRFMVILS